MRLTVSTKMNMLGDSFRSQECRFGLVPQAVQGTRIPIQLDPVMASIKAWIELKLLVWALQQFDSLVLSEQRLRATYKRKLL